MLPRRQGGRIAGAKQAVEVQEVGALPVAALMGWPCTAAVLRELCTSNLLSALHYTALPQVLQGVLYCSCPKPSRFGCARGRSMTSICTPQLGGLLLTYCYLPSQPLSHRTCVGCCRL